jgi:hypothetical protein
MATSYRCGVPPPLPPRYRLEVRLGRDGDIDEWLGVDTSLDRPVLIRIVGPEADTDRRARFLDAVRAAAAVSHGHIAAVYEAGEVLGGVYSICEWGGGVTMAHRLSAGETMPVEEFMGNAAGMAAGLAALHAAGALHGAIDPSAILYSAVHPAKLTAFGRPASSTTTAEDVHDLAAALDSSLTGQPAGRIPPSEVIDGVDPAVDRALEHGLRGIVGAAELAEELQAAPTTPALETGPSDSPWRGLALTGVLLAVAAGMVVLGGSLTARPQSLVLFPAGPTTSAPDLPRTTPPPTTSTTTTIAAGSVAIVGVEVFDPPPGDEQENNDDIVLLTDGDPATSWSTERYRVPVWRFKPGVGVVFEVTGTARTVELRGVTDDTSWSLGWSAAKSPDPARWQRLASGRVAGGRATVQVPPRTDGAWMLWLTDLPDIGGVYNTSVAEVSFRP